MKGAQNNFFFFNKLSSPSCLNIQPAIYKGGTNKRKEKGTVNVHEGRSVCVCVFKRDREGEGERNTMLMEIFSFLTHWV